METAKGIDRSWCYRAHTQCCRDSQRYRIAQFLDRETDVRLFAVLWNPAELSQTTARPRIAIHLLFGASLAFEAVRPIACLLPLDPKRRPAALDGLANSYLLKG
jgi:hypothetical protein